MRLTLFGLSENNGDNRQADLFGGKMVISWILIEVHLCEICENQFDICWKLVCYGVVKYVIFLVFLHQNCKQYGHNTRPFNFRLCNFYVRTMTYFGLCNFCLCIMTYFGLYNCYILVVTYFAPYNASRYTLVRYIFWGESMPFGVRYNVDTYIKLNSVIYSNTRPEFCSQWTGGYGFVSTAIQPAQGFNYLTVLFFFLLLVLLLLLFWFKVHKPRKI